MTGDDKTKMNADESAYHSSMAFDPKAKALWLRASGDNDQAWPNDRLMDFQEAVEERAAWLYDSFYRELGFASWENRLANSDPPVQ